MISIANNGRLVRNLDENKIKKVLTLLYGPQHSENPFLNMWLRRRSSGAASSEPSPKGPRGSSAKGNAESGV